MPYFDKVRSNLKLLGVFLWPFWATSCYLW